VADFMGGVHLFGAIMAALARSFDYAARRYLVARYSTHAWTH
jgi:hypothetical protein